MKTKRQKLEALMADMPQYKVVDVTKIQDEYEARYSETIAKQAKILSKVKRWLSLNGLTQITHSQAADLAEVNYLELNGLTSITDKQAESLSKLKRGSISKACGKLIDKYKRNVEILIRSIVADVNSSGKITDEQAESLSKGKSWLDLNGLTTLTDKQAESLSKVKRHLELDGLTEITDQQAESLSKVKVLSISEACRKLIEKYK